MKCDISAFFRSFHSNQSTNMELTTQSCHILLDHLTKYNLGPILCFPSTQDYSSTETAATVSCGTWEAHQGKGTNVLLPHVEQQWPLWGYMNLCLLLSGCRMEGTHVRFFDLEGSIGFGSRVCCHLHFLPDPVHPSLAQFCPLPTFHTTPKKVTTSWQ